MVGNCHPLLASAKEAAGRMRKNMAPRTSHKGEKQNHALEKGIAAANRGWMSEKYLPPADQAKCFFLTSPFIEPARKLVIVVIDDSGCRDYPINKSAHLVGSFASLCVDLRVLDRGLEMISFVVIVPFSLDGVTENRRIETDVKDPSNAIAQAKARNQGKGFDWDSAELEKAED
jgi:hypothetical protein